MRRELTRSSSVVKIGATAAFFALLLTGCQVSNAGLATIVGSGEIVTQERVVEKFHKIRVGSALDAVIVHGDEQSVSVTADDNVVDKIETVVAINGALVVRRADGLKLHTKSPIRLRIVTPVCDSVVVSGGSEVSLKEFTQKEFRTKVTEASKFTLDSQIDHLELQASGASKVYADHHESKTVDIDLSGASQVSLSAADTIEGTIAGASSVTYSGDPNDVAIKTTGSSRVRRQKSES